jgi:hypothetical protein
VVRSSSFVFTFRVVNSGLDYSLALKQLLYAVVASFVSLVIASC